MFVGEIIVKLDLKGRIVFPASFKKQMSEEDLQNGFVLRKDIHEPCYVLYPAKEWELLLSIMRRKLNPFNKDHASLFRDFHRQSTKLFFDGSYRLLLPKKYLDDIGIEKEFIMLGQKGKIEIWNNKTYDSNKLDPGKFAEKLEEILGADTNFYE